MLKDLKEYPWSSYRVHAMGRRMGQGRELIENMYVQAEKGGAGDKGEDGERNNWGRDISGED